MKFGRPLAIIVHYTVQFNLECCKSSVSDMGPNTILNMLNVLSKDVLKVKLQKFQHTINATTTCCHSPLRYNSIWSVAKCPDMGPNTIK